MSIIYPCKKGCGASVDKKGDTCQICSLPKKNVKGTIWGTNFIVSDKVS